MAFDGSNDIKFGTDKVEAKCYYYQYDGEQWEKETIDTSDYEWKCTNAATLGTDLDDYTCTVSFDKSSKMGIASDSEFIIFSFGPSTIDGITVAQMNAIEKKDRYFPTNSIEAINFGSDTCNFSSLYSMATGLVALAGLTLF